MVDARSLCAAVVGVAVFEVWQSIFCVPRYIPTVYIHTYGGGGGGGGGKSPDNCTLECNNISCKQLTLMVVMVIRHVCCL